MSLCRNAELACEVTLQPLRRYPLDAAILFSDILTVPDAMGLGLYFEQGEGPRFERPITSMADVQALPVPDPEDELGYVMNAVRTIRRELKGEVPLIGFSGSPWTLATTMVEGQLKAFTKIKQMMYAEPMTLHLLLDKLADSVIAYQRPDQGGCPGGHGVRHLGRRAHPRDYRDFSAIHAQDRRRPHSRARRSPRAGHPVHQERWSVAGADCRHRLRCAGAGLDHRHCRRQAPGRRQGGAAGQHGSSMLYASPARIREEVASILAGFGHGNGHVFNLGHGIHQDVNPEHAGVFVNAVHELSAQYHGR